MKKLHTEVSKGSQSWNYERLLDHKGKRLKVLIKRDSYDNQSYAKMYIHKDDQWNLLTGIPYANMSSLSISYVDSNITDKDFVNDYLTLVNKSKLILD